MMRDYSSQNVSNLIDLFTSSHSEGDDHYVESLVRRTYDGDAHALFKLLHKLTDDPVYYDISRAARHAPDHMRFMEAFSRGQMASKGWLVQTLKDMCHHEFIADIAVVGGWYGHLSYMLAHTCVDPEFIHTIDIDPSCKQVAETLCKGLPVTAITDDMFNIDYSQYETVVNTSCEHISDFETWYDMIPSETYVILQSNNYFDHPEHVNCVENLEQFAQMTPMLIQYEGELALSKYTRYMRIGYKW